MDYKMLGSHIEYLQAARRLEEVLQAPAGTPQAQERKELMARFRQFESDIKNINKPVTIKSTD